MLAKRYDPPALPSQVLVGCVRQVLFGEAYTEEDYRGTSRHLYDLQQERDRLLPEELAARPIMALLKLCYPMCFVELVKSYESLSYYIFRKLKCLQVELRAWMCALGLRCCWFRV